MILTSCRNETIKRSTLHDIEGNTPITSASGNLPASKSDDEIRKAYATYLEHASKDDSSRADALSRLAALEFNLSEQKLKNHDGSNDDAVEAADDKFYNARLDRSIELLRTSLQDYPDAEGNDKTLYQLARAYDQKGDAERSKNAIEKLVINYPKSKYYIEGQFRLAEDAFSRKRYALAEDKYTEVIGSKSGSIFYEKSLYKRGWSRFKQEFYFEAIDDYLRVVKLNEFDDFHQLSASKKGLFNEYFHAIGLSFSYLGGPEAVNDYFNNNINFKHLYYSYVNVSNIYSKEERVNDAANTLEYFAKHNAKSKHVPEALLKVIGIWEDGGFSSKMNGSIENFYANYQPNSTYWNKRKNIDKRILKLVKDSLRKHALKITATYHKRFQDNRSISDYNNAMRWYDNYLNSYFSYSKKDNIHFLYASLLAENYDYNNALIQYELAAYDSDIIIDKVSAYEAILLSSKLGQKSKDPSPWVKKLIHYSTLYSQQYPNDTKIYSIIAHAGEIAYKYEMFNKAITLAELLPGNNISQKTVAISTIKANSYFKLAKYVDAENTYRAILMELGFPAKNTSKITDSLALAIYYQGKYSDDKGDSNSAIQHYARISRLAPTSDISATGMYDAIALSMKNDLWLESIKYIKEFQRLYPHHKQANNVSKKLAAAYLNSKQNIAAAKELEKLAINTKNKDYQLSALWKAGEIYESNKDYSSALRSFKQYAKNFHRPFPQYIESMFKVVSLYKLSNDSKSANIWQRKITKADKKSQNSLKTERTKYIASAAALHLARNSHNDFTNSRLVLPLKKNLKKKKLAMQKAVNLYGRASSYAVAETATEATHAIADIYNEFSSALLQSERPKHLNADELEQ